MQERISWNELGPIDNLSELIAKLEEHLDELQTGIIEPIARALSGATGLEAVKLASTLESLHKLEAAIQAYIDVLRRHVQDNSIETDTDEETIFSVRKDEFLQEVSADANNGLDLAFIYSMLKLIDSCTYICIYALKLYDISIFEMISEIERFKHRLMAYLANAQADPVEPSQH